jgi:hypothetical protein
MDLYIHFPISLRGVVLNQLTTGQLYSIKFSIYFFCKFFVFTAIFCFINPDDPPHLTRISEGLFYRNMNDQT